MKNPPGACNEYEYGAKPAALIVAKTLVGSATVKAQLCAGDVKENGASVEREMTNAVSVAVSCGVYGWSSSTSIVTVKLPAAAAASVKTPPSKPAPACAALNLCAPPTLNQPPAAVTVASVIGTPSTTLLLTAKVNKTMSAGFAAVNVKNAVARKLSSESSDTRADNVNAPSVVNVAVR